MNDVRQQERVIRSVNHGHVLMALVTLSYVECTYYWDWWLSVFSWPLSPTIPPRLCAMSTGDGFGPLTRTAGILASCMVA